MGFVEHRYRTPYRYNTAAHPLGIAEVLSPHNGARDRVDKRRLYAEHGVAFYWTVDPLERTHGGSAPASGDSAPANDGDANRERNRRKRERAKRRKGRRGKRGR